MFAELQCPLQHWEHPENTPRSHSRHTRKDSFGNGANEQLGKFENEDLILNRREDVTPRAIIAEDIKIDGSSETVVDL